MVIIVIDGVGFRLRADGMMESARVAAFVRPPDWGLHDEVYSKVFGGEYSTIRQHLQMLAPNFPPNRFLPQEKKEKKVEPVEAPNEVIL